MSAFNGEVGTMNAGNGWFEAMPALPCPEGSTVRRGDLTGVVTHNPGNGCWTVVLIGHYCGKAHDDDSQNPDCPTPESAGWRHALDTDAGWARVARSLTRSSAGRRAIREAWAYTPCLPQVIDRLFKRLLQGDDIDDRDRLKLAQAAAKTVTQ